MITALDTSILIDVFANDPKHGHASAVSLRRCLQEGTLVVCDVVWVETRAVFGDGDAFESAMATLGVQFSPLSAEASSHAGAMWRNYRRTGGSRRRVMADFLIGSHAVLQADRLLTRDRGYYQTHFKGLQVVG